MGRRTCPAPPPVGPDDAAIEGDGCDLVLVIDDEAVQWELTGGFLRRQGFAVREAAGGPSGLEMARSSQRLTA